MTQIPDPTVPDHPDSNITQHSTAESGFYDPKSARLKIDYSTIMEVKTASDTDVAVSDQIFYLDFSFTDPAIALNRVASAPALERKMVARVAVGTNTALGLLQSLSIGLLGQGVPLTIYLDDQLMVSFKEQPKPEGQ